MFEQEAQLLASLQHPNLPSIYDYFGEGGRWYLVMDFIEGTTLNKRLEQTPGHVLSLYQTLDIGIQLAKVLGYLHNRPSPIIFRDLKPLNIMMTPDDNVYLIDFGIARLFKLGQAQDTVSYISAGYAAPEQYGTAQTSPRSDIYSLGATLHQLLSGHQPNESPFKFKPLQTYNPQLPTMLTELVANMVDMEPSQRPSSMKGVRKELEQIQMKVKQNIVTSIPPTPYMPLSYNSRPTLQPNPYFISSGQVQQNKQIVRPLLPRYKFWKTLLISVIAAGASLIGLLVGPIAIIIIFSILLIEGFIVGKFVVLRQLGFLAGCISMLPYIILFTTQSGNLSGVYTSLIFATVTILPVGGLIGLLGTWIATINHPLYGKP